MRLSNTCGPVAIGIAAVALLLPSSAGAATITVNAGTDDPPDASGINGNCTLREAIGAANGNGVRDTCVAGSAVELDTINFVVSSVTLDETGIGEDGNVDGDLDPTGGGAGLTIDGGAGGVTVDAAAIDRVFDVQAGTGTVTLDSLTVTNGLDGIGAGGAGIRALPGTTTVVSDSSVTLNTTTGGGAGIGSSGTLTLDDTLVQDNVSNGGGAGVSNVGSLTVQNGSRIFSNEANGSGGGIFQSAGSLSISDSEIFSNDAHEGPGGGIAIISTPTSLTIDDSEIGDNKAGITAPGNPAGTGGGIDYNGTAGGATLTITDTTMEGNQAFTSGGGIALRNSPMSLDLQRSTLKFNQVLNDEATPTFSINGGGISDAAVTGTTTIADSLFLANSTVVAAADGLNNGGAVRLNGPSLVSRTTFSANSVSGGSTIFGGPRGGGIAVFSGTANLVNVTLNGNNATTTAGDGGGLDAGGGTVNLFNVTSDANDAADLGDGIFEGIGTVTTRASIFDDACSTTGGLTDQGDNVESANTCGLAAGFNLNPMLGDLQNNGGPQIGSPGDPSSRLTHALPIGSPALDRVAGNCVDQTLAPLLSDARTFARPEDGDGNGSANCDAGAFERTALVVLPPPDNPVTPPAASPATTPAKKKCKKKKRPAAAAKKCKKKK